MIRKKQSGLFFFLCVCVCCFLVLIRFRAGGGRNILLPRRALGGCQGQFPLPEAGGLCKRRWPLLLAPTPKTGLAGVTARGWAPLSRVPDQRSGCWGTSRRYPGPSTWPWSGSHTEASVVPHGDSPKDGHGGLRARQGTSQIRRRLRQGA